MVSVPAYIRFSNGFRKKLFTFVVYAYLVMSKKETISFEFFPPKDDAGRASLRDCVLDLARFNPSFVTVTFGAGGSTRSGTFETTQMIKENVDIPVGAHLSYFGIPKEELFAYADMLWDAGIHHLVALRGDIPAGQSASDYREPQYFEYTSEFVEALLARHPFDISVGAYPEKHPDAPSLDADIIALRKKCDAGSARAITQFFFDVDIYADFITKTKEAGISTPIVPGLLPVRDFKRACSFAEKCQAHIPDHVKEIFTATDDPVAAGIHLMVAQIEALRRVGVTHFHFYTLNRSDMVRAACERAGISSF